MYIRNLTSGPSSKEKSVRRKVISTVFISLMAKFVSKIINQHMFHRFFLFFTLSSIFPSLLAFCCYNSEKIKTEIIGRSSRPHI
eukprot:gene5299-3802_t